MDLGCDRLKEKVIAMLRDVYDPEIPVNIYELGLVYDVRIDESGGVGIVMTLTSPMCPVAEILPVEIEARTREIEGVRDVCDRSGLGPALESRNDVRGRAPRAGNVARMIDEVPLMNDSG